MECEEDLFPKHKTVPRRLARFTLYGIWVEIEFLTFYEIISLYVKRKERRLRIFHCASPGGAHRYHASRPEAKPASDVSGRSFTGGAQGASTRSPGDHAPVFNCRLPLAWHSCMRSLYG
ncbi:hypothetical protein TNCV_2968731 [Trichonephila clavipes]|nr:hypothetical protein TNCV_2968731 [Trichonephila clavipes]